MSDGSEKRPLTKMRWSVSIKTRTFASVKQMCSDAHSITLRQKYLFCKTNSI